MLSPPGRGLAFASLAIAIGLNGCSLLFDVDGIAGGIGSTSGSTSSPGSDASSATGQASGSPAETGVVSGSSGAHEEEASLSGSSTGEASAGSADGAATGASGSVNADASSGDGALSSDVASPSDAVQETSADAASEEGAAVCAGMPIGTTNCANDTACCQTGAGTAVGAACATFGTNTACIPRCNAGSDCGSGLCCAANLSAFPKAAGQAPIAPGGLCLSPSQAAEGCLSNDANGYVCSGNANTGYTCVVSHSDPAATDPVVGCYAWNCGITQLSGNNGATKTGCSSGVDTGVWEPVGPNKYEIVWKSGFDDVMTLSNGELLPTGSSNGGKTAPATTCP